MAIYQELESIIATRIYENDGKEVSAEMLRQALFAMVSSLGAGYQYVGVATRDTKPGTPDQKVFYIAAQPGTYTYFGTGITVADGEVAILKYDTAWHKEVTGAATAAQVTELGQEVTSDISQLGQQVDELGQQVDELGQQVDELGQKSSMPLVDEDGFYVTDEDMNVGMKYDEAGFDVAKVSSHFIDVLKAAGISADDVMASNAAEVNEDGFFIVDENLNVGVKVDNDGIHAKNILEYEII